VKKSLYLCSPAPVLNHSAGERVAVGIGEVALVGDGGWRIWVCRFRQAVETAQWEVETVGDLYAWFNLGDGLLGLG
jgi:hypothetical protein